MIRYISLCAGIEAFSCAVHGIDDFVPVAFSEIEPFPCAVLAHHYPDVPNIGDMTKIDGRKYAGTTELVVGGTPCQDFSIAGTRKGLDGERSGLAYHFVRLVSEIEPRWVLWENVPGAFTTNGGRDFARFTAALAGCGYHLAWRVLDAQYFGVPQRRRRIFLVGHSGGWQCAAEVLFELASLCGYLAPGGKAGKGAPGKTEAGLDGGALRERERERDGGHSNPRIRAPRGNMQRCRDGQSACYTMQGFGDYRQCGVASPVKRRDYKDATDLVLQ